MPAAIGDAIVANRFFLEFGGHQVTTLQEVSGIEDESDVLETNQMTQGGKIVILKMLGAMPLKGGKLTLKYPAIKEDPIKKWYDSIVGQKVADARTNVSLIIYDLLGATLLTFDFAMAWPSKYSFGSFTVKGNDAVAVTVTLEHTGMTVKGYNG
jgi:phage tail-like protein